MTEHEFLVPLQGGQSDVPLLQAALKLGHAMNAQVTSVYGQIDPIEMLAWPSDGGFATGSVLLIEAAQSGNDEAWANQQARLLEIAKSEPMLTIERLVGHPDIQIAKRGTLCDMAIFSCESARGKTGVSTIFTALLMDAYAPVLVMRCDPAPKFDIVAIAWDGGLEASRAAKAALMFLKSAEQVIIIQAVAALDEFDHKLTDPSRLQDWLTRHDIKASLHKTTASHDAAADILEACVTLGVDLLVCGAYGHSRAREFIFGGVTRTLIKTTTSPSLFLSH
jgi:nucleotide-binding universal stress UspA family protein